MAPTYENGIWKGDVEPLGEDWPEYRNILLERLRKFPSRIAQIHAITRQKQTYAQLVDKVIRCSVWLKKQDLKEDDIVGICSYRHMDTAVPLLASILVGAIVHPWWDATLTDDVIQHYLDVCKPKILFADETKVNRIRNVLKKNGDNIKIVAFNDPPHLDTLSSIIESQSAEDVASFQCDKIHDINQPALIMATSGTTGYPKGALLPYSWLMCRMMPIRETPRINYWLAGIIWATGLSNTIKTILECSTAVIHPDPNDRNILEIIQEFKVENIPSLNTANAIRMWASDLVQYYDVSSVQNLVMTGSTMHPKAEQYMIENFKNAVVINGYGCTELTWLSVCPKGSGKPTSCGSVENNVQMKVVDVNTGKTLGFNQEGEVCAKFPYGMLGYYNNPEATRAAYDDDGWYHTGDIGYHDEDGEFFIVDRLKDLIKFRMEFDFAPLVVEQVIMKCPGISEAAVIAKPDIEDFEQPMAFVTLQKDASTTEQDIINFVAKNLPDHMHLRGGVVILDELPYTQSGKIAKKELKKRIPSF